jgi:hypothetical protein
MAQQLMLDLVLNMPDGEDIDLNALKLHVSEFAAKITKDEEYDSIRDQLKAQCVVEIKGAAPAKPAGETPPATPPAEGDKKEEEKTGKEKKAQDKADKAEAKAEAKEEKKLAEAKT